MAYEVHVPSGEEETQPTQDWHCLYAFGLPNGSIRAILAIGIFGSIWFWMYSRPDVEIPSYLRDLMFIIMGHYFAVRHRTNDVVIGPNPLFLPKGSIRSILLLGCIITTSLLVYQSRIIVHEPEIVRLSHSGVTMILVAGFMLGVVLNYVSHKVPRWVEDIRAATCLIAVGLLIGMVFNLIHVPDTGYWHNAQKMALQYRAEDVLAAFVGFYFGSKS